MKKILTLVLSFVMIFTFFTACNNREIEEEPISSMKEVAIINKAKDGKIPEIQFGIGASVKEVKDYYTAAFESDPNATELVESKAGEYAKLDLGSYAYYYLAEDEEAGIVGVTSVSTAFGFSTGTVTSIEDVKSAVKDDTVETITTEDELFFLPGTPPEGAKKLYYMAGDYELKLFFFNDYLTAVSLFK